MTKRKYRHIPPVHPETVVRWFLDLHHYWFDESLGPNQFTGMHDEAKRYLSYWIESGTFAPATTLLQSYVKAKFDEWLKSSWKLERGGVLQGLSGG